MVDQPTHHQATGWQSNQKPQNPTTEDADEKYRIASTYRPGTFGCHEALHMASVARDFVEEHVCNHPTIGLNPEWQALADKACEALFELYQAIGKEHL